EDERTEDNTTRAEGCHGGAPYTQATTRPGAPNVSPSLPSRGGYHDFRSSSVPSLPSGPADTSAMWWAPGGRLAPHSSLIGLPHASLASRPFAYWVRSATRSGHIACGFAIDQARNAWSAYISSFIRVVLILASRK